jgi:hypothetical protein
MAAAYGVFGILELRDAVKLRIHNERSPKIWWLRFFVVLLHRKSKHTTIMSKQKILKIIVSVLIAALTALGAAIGLNSCNVVRTITNRSEYYQRGDTSVMIQTKTTESYDASKKF